MLCKTEPADPHSQNSSTSGGFSDMPITDVKDDKLGFGEMAKHLAAFFLENDLSRGLVISVEGAWGSGKSSLVNLALNELKRDQQTIRPGGNLETSKNKSVVVEFSPWLIGSREELLQQFFLDLGNASYDELPLDIRKNTRNLMKAYSVLASGVALPAELTSDMIYPQSGKLVGGLIRKSAQLTSKYSTPSLAELKFELQRKLNELESSIIVVIDDLDRLEPKEIVEVLRLVRAVADFPNVGYILVFDPEIVSESVKKSLNIRDGHAFLEKIVQASIRVPDAQRFDLKNWLSAEFVALRTADELDRDKQDRVLSVLDDWAGRYLVTPRDVIRTVNLLRLNFVPVRKYVDPGDALFLQLVHLKNNNLFQWIQRYVVMLSVFADGGKIPDGAGIRMGHDLLAISDTKYCEERAEFLYHLQSHLPGITSSRTSEGLEFVAFSNLEVNSLSSYSRARRLASPSHFSLYFSFTHTAGYPGDDEVEQFVELAVVDRDAAKTKFARWASQERPQGGRMGEAALDRLIKLGPNITQDQVEGIFDVLGRTMDDLARNSNPSWGYPNFLLGARSQIFGLIEIIPNGRRMQVLHNLFISGKSLAWLAGIIRFNCKSEESGWASIGDNAVLTEREFTVLSHQFADRLVAEEPKTLLETPYFLFLLYTWVLVGDKARCLEWVGYVASTDVGFLDIVEKLTSRIGSSQSGVVYRIQPKDLVCFFGSIEVPVERLRTIARGASDKDLQQRANGVLSLIDKS